LKDNGKRNKKIIEAVEEYGYRQCEIADYLSMYFTSVSSIMKEKREQRTFGRDNIFNKIMA